MASRRHRSKRTQRPFSLAVVCGPIKRAVGNPLDCTDANGKPKGERFPRMIARFGLKCRSRERSAFFRLCEHYAVKTEIVESVKGTDGRGNEIDIATCVEFSGHRGSMGHVCRWIDRQLWITASLPVSHAEPGRAAGSGTLSESAKRFSKLNYNQRREVVKNSGAMAAISKAEKRDAKELQLAKRCQSNSLEIEFPAMPDYRPLNGAPPVKSDCGKAITIELEPEYTAALSYGFAAALSFWLNWEQAKRDAKRVRELKLPGSRPRNW